MSSFTKPLAHLDLPTRLLVRVVSFGGRSIKAENDILVKSTSDPLIFVFNHNNYLETLQVGSYLLAHRQGKKPAFISDWMYGRLPVFAWPLNRIDPIYTYRKNARFAVLNKYQQKADGQAVCQACLERLQNGQSLGIFPEGTRNHDPHRLKRGRRGVGEIALRSGVPVLPAGLDFTRRSRNGRIPWFSPVILRFGAPLTFPEEAQAFRRTILGRPPFYRHARHIIQNERQVTRIVGTYKGERFPYYVVQIAGRSVNGIDSFVQPGEEVDKGSIFGIIRIGSQVDLVVPHLPDLKIKTRPGARVRAGETILVA